MPELPEVEVVRAGLAPAITGAQITAVSVLDARALKRHLPLGQDGNGPDGGGGHGRTLSSEAGMRRAADFERRLTGQMLLAPLRRGKFMWVPLVTSRSGSGEAMLAHLGMSGQLLLRATDATDDRHVRIRLWIDHPEHGELRLDFADQRLFGSLAIDRLVKTDPSGEIPAQAAHIARDPLDERFDDAAFVRALMSRQSAVKKLILDQGLVSGVGNIYADEALWLARIHPETAGTAISRNAAYRLLEHLREVFAKALAEGGTSFDAQYVNVNGQAGYFAHSLNAYGRGGEPCPRCGGFIKRVPFAGRSSHFCPRCQRRR
ncbi:MAG: bifunctional DNA-formamidopyrimidine glycosylase/DNA-(apurinic or apyrimidinic site) lyase [Leucobacter sp.]